MKKIAFLDRDGTLNVEKDYLYNWKDFEWIGGAKDFIKQLKENGYFVAVITNQSGIARGRFKAQDVVTLHLKMNDDLMRTHNVEIDRFEMCPHHPDFDSICKCRKPDVGMMRRIVNYTGVLEPNLSFIVGDNISDYNAGQNFGIKSFLILTGHGQKHKNTVPKNNIINNLNEIFEKL